MEGRCQTSWHSKFCREEDVLTGSLRRCQLGGNHVLIKVVKGSVNAGDLLPECCG